MRIANVNQFRQSQETIVISNNFAKIISFSEVTGITEYEFTFKIDKNIAISQSISSIDIAISKSIDIPKENTIKPALSQITATDALEFLTSNNSKNKDLKLSISNSQINTSTTATVTSKLNFDTSTINKPIVKNVVRTKRVAIQKTENMSLPNLGVKINLSQPVNTPNINLSLFNLLLKNKIDISSTLGSNVNSITTKNSFNGIKPARVAINKKINLLDKNVNNILAITSNIQNKTFNNDDFESTIEIPYMEKVIDNFITIKKNVIIKNETIGQSNFLVTFTPQKKEGQSTKAIKKIVKHQNLLKIFLTPKIAPSVTSTSIAAANKNIFVITQLDKNANIVKVYRKSISNTTNINDVNSMTYSFIGNINVAPGNSAQITDRITSSNVQIYRFIAANTNGSIASTFTNVIVSNKPTKTSRRNILSNIAIVATPQPTAVALNIANIMPGFVSATLQRKNLTLHESSYTNVGKSNLLISDNSLVFIDKNVKSGMIYDYACLLHMRCGSEYHTGTCIYEHTDSTIGVEIETTAPEIEKIATKNKDTGNVRFDVKFSIESKLNDTTVDIIKTLLRRQGIDDLYIDELKNDREKFSKLLSHEIHRINQSTGEIENLGIISNAFFSDHQQSKLFASKPLEQGIRYQYSISTLLRDPETLFENYTKIKKSPQKLIDIITPTDLSSREYAFSPAKFLHPLVLQTGTLSTITSRKLLHAKDEFAYGHLGNAKIVDILVPRSLSQLTKINVQRADENTNIITWNFSGDIDNIDYFIVSLRQFDTENVIGVVHALSSTNIFEYIHDLTNIEKGTAVYTVMGVLNTFEFGQKIISDRIVI